jgi:hypothetical protein
MRSSSANPLESYQNTQMVFAQQNQGIPPQKLMNTSGAASTMVLNQSVTF